MEKAHTNASEFVDYKKIAKVVLVGDREVGKTSLRKQLVSESFSRNYLATLGVDFATKKMHINSDTVELQIWDIAGQKNYSKLAERFVRKSDGVMLIYDVVNETSFTNLVSRMESILKLDLDEKPVFMIVGNKIDLEQQERTPEEINQYFIEHGVEIERNIPCMFTSAKTSENVEQTFNRMATVLLYSKQLERVIDHTA